MIGQDGVREALTDAGIRILEGEPEEADLVVVGFDGGATYGSLKRASLLVQRGARLVATNADGSYPPPTGCGREPARSCLSSRRRRGGARSSASRSTRCSRPVAGGGRRPAARRGDRLDTDIEGAARLVGHDARAHGRLRTEDVERTGIRPTVIAEDVSARCSRTPRGGRPRRYPGSWRREGCLRVTEHPGSRTRE